MKKRLAILTCLCILVVGSISIFASSYPYNRNIQFGNSTLYTLSNGRKSRNVLYPSVTWSTTDVYGLPVYFGVTLTANGYPAVDGYTALLPGQSKGLSYYFYQDRAPMLNVSLVGYVADSYADITVGGTWNPDAGMVLQ